MPDHRPNTLSTARARCLLTGILWLLIFLVLTMASQAAAAEASSPLADELVPSAPEEVPDVVGMSIDQARSSLEHDGFTVRATPKFTYFAGQHNRVFDQTPRGGTAINFKVPVIQLFYYDKDYQPPVKDAETGADQPQAEARKVRVPRVEGFEIRDAIRILRRAGLALEIKDETDTDVMGLDGLVSYQEPAANSRVEPGTLVQVDIYIFNEAPRTLHQRQLLRERLKLPSLGFGQPQEEKEDDEQKEKDDDS